MPERIRGITVEIGGDTTGLSKALKKSNTEIKSTKTQLKDVEKLLKLDPTNIDLLRQREKLLNDAVRETGDKLSTLKEAQRTMDANGVDRNSEQYMALQREIISTEQELGRLQTAARDSNARLSQVGAICDKVADKTDKLAQKTAKFSGAAAAGLGALVKAGYDAVTMSDDLNTKSKQSGFTTAEIQAFEYAADRIDVSTDVIIGAGRKLKTTMKSTNKDTQAAFKQLGVETTNLDGTLRNSTDVFWDCVEALGNVEDETERDALAMQIFGKSADELAGLIDDGGAAFHECAKEAEDLGLILDQDTLDSLNAVNDEIDKIKAMFKAAWAKNGAKVVEKLTPAFEKLAAKIENLVEWFANLNSDSLYNFMKLLAGVAALSPVLKFVSGFAKGIKGVTKALKVVLPVIKTVNAFLLANPIILIIAAIAALIVIIVKFKDQIIGAIEKVTKWLHEKLGKDWTEVFGPVLGGILNKFCSGFLKVWDAVSGAVKTAVGVISDIFNGNWAGVWETAKKGVTDACADMREGLQGVDSWMNDTFTQDWRDKYGDRLGGWMNSASEKILGAWNDDILPALNGAVDWLEDTFSGDWEHAVDNIKELGGKVWDGIQSGWDTCKEKLNGALQWFDRTFVESWRNTWSNIKSVGTGAFDGIKKAWDTVKDKFQAVKDWLSDTFTTDWNGIWNGISGTFSTLWEGLGEMAKSPLNKIIGYLNSLIGKINNFIDTINGMEILGWSANIGHIGEIPLLAKGGTVVHGSAIVGEAGAELLTVSGGRATVTPLGKGSAGAAGNNCITIYTQEMTESQVDYLVGRINRGLGVMA